MVELFFIHLKDEEGVGWLRLVSEDLCVLSSHWVMQRRIIHLWGSTINVHIVYDVVTDKVCTLCHPTGSKRLEIRTLFFIIMQVRNIHADLLM